MAEYISREKIAAEARELSTHVLNEWDTMGVLALIDRQPAADVAEVRHGHWENAKGKFRDCEGGAVFIVTATCSVCGRQVNEAYWKGNPPQKTPYCPNCGAKMDESEDKGNG